jgi:hypothetical protein
LLPHRVNRELVAVIEDRPEARFDDPQVRVAVIASSESDAGFPQDAAWLAAKYLGRNYYKLAAVSSACTVAEMAALKKWREGEPAGAEEAAQVALVRDLFANPFRPVTFDPAWLTPSVRSLAESMYRQRDFDLMPLLGGALEQAGCTNEDILNHCRDPKQVHVRGCWVVDLLLGKE